MLRAMQLLVTLLLALAAALCGGGADARGAAAVPSGRAAAGEQVHGAPQGSPAFSAQAGDEAESENGGAEENRDEVGAAPSAPTQASPRRFLDRATRRVEAQAGQDRGAAGGRAPPGL